MTKKDFNYNESLKEIEQILLKIEQDDLNIDELSDKVKRVSLLIKLCKEKLHNTEVEVEKILKDLEV